MILEEIHFCLIYNNLIAWCFISNKQIKKFIDVLNENSEKIEIYVKYILYVHIFNYKNYTLKFIENNVLSC